MRPKESEVYKRLKQLGQGSYGKVYLAESRKDSNLCVIKQMDLKYLSEEEKEEAYKEAKIMAQLKHPNIINYREVYKTVKGKLCIVMDYAEGGDLGLYIKKCEGHMKESKILDWFTQICLAIKHCHDRKVIHRDIKTSNMFLTKDQRIKLGDFGIAKLLNHTRDKVNTMVGTPYYLAPELIESRPYSFKCDIWSLGVVLYEMCCKCPPFNGDSIAQLALKIVRGQFQQIPTYYSKELKTLVNQLLQVNQDRRPTVHQILKLPIITNRIKNFLSETIKRNEFDHTVLHNQNIQLSDVTIPLLEEGDIAAIQKTETQQEHTPKNKNQLPGIQSPKVALYKYDQKDGKEPKVQKKLPEIKILKPEKPPITRQMSSRPCLRHQPQTPEVQQRRAQISEVSSRAKLNDKRFVTKESPDSFVGDQVLEKAEINSKSDNSNSPKFFFDDKNQMKKSSQRDLFSNENHSKKGAQSSEEEVKKYVVKYRVHAQPKIIEHYSRQKERKVSDELVTHSQRDPFYEPKQPIQQIFSLQQQSSQQQQQQAIQQFQLQPHQFYIKQKTTQPPLKLVINQQVQNSKMDHIELQQISETPEQRLSDQNTLNFFNSEDQFQYHSEQKNQIEIRPYDIQQGLDQKKVINYEITQKKPIRNSNSNVERAKETVQLEAPKVKQGSNTDEDKKKKKVHKIIFKDPFQKQEAKKLRNSEEDLEQMLSELKQIITPSIESKVKITNPDLIQDDDHSKVSPLYSEDSSDDAQAQSLPQTQVNTWMQGYSRDDEYSNMQTVHSKHNSEIVHMKQLLANKLGNNFERLLKVAKHGQHLEDLGQANLKYTIIDTIKGIDETVADYYATLLITLILEMKGQGLQ